MFEQKALYIENLRISLLSIRSHLLRTILTILIIAFGLMALVGIITAIKSIETSISSNFSRMGANTFSIENHGLRSHMGGGKNIIYSNITYDQARKFKELYDYTAIVSVSTTASRTATLKYGDVKTNPNIGVLGVDENYVETSGNEIAKGRNFSIQEIRNGSRVVVLGSDLASTLFKNGESPLDKIVSIGGGKYRVIGVLKLKGSSMGFSGDRSCLLSNTNVRQFVSTSQMSFRIDVMVSNQLVMENAIGEAISTFRNVRKLTASQKNDFDVNRSDNLAQLLISNMSYVAIAATVIGFITLLGAAIGLMNIMLVSVTERTMEIGVRKALGATSEMIKRQFLMEAIVICQIGGILGILLGILAGNIISVFTGGVFVIPWLWITLGIILCFIVGLLSGIWPAIRAARLDPIEALRYE